MEAQAPSHWAGPAHQPRPRGGATSHVTSSQTLNRTCQTRRRRLNHDAPITPTQPRASDQERLHRQPGAQQIEHFPSRYYPYGPSGVLKPELSVCRFPLPAQTALASPRVQTSLHGREIPPSLKKADSAETSDSSTPYLHRSLPFSSPSSLIRISLKLRPQG